MINVGSKIKGEVLDGLRKVVWKEMGQLCMINIGSKIEDEVLDRLRKVIWREMEQLCYIENRLKASIRSVVDKYLSKYDKCWLKD